MKTSDLRAAINFIQCLLSSADRDRFQDLLPMMMMQTLIEALNCRQEATGQGALVLLIELAGTEPRFLGRQLVNVMGSMLQIAEDESLEEGTRHLAVEFMITLAEAGERKLTLFKSHVMPRFISQLFVILMCWNYGSLTIEMVAHYWNGGSLLKWWLTIGMVAHYWNGGYTIEMVAIIFLYKLISSSFVIIPSHTSLSERERRVKEES